jgi:hypothetical protein
MSTEKFEKCSPIHLYLLASHHQKRFASRGGLFFPVNLPHETYPEMKADRNFPNILSP